MKAIRRIALVGTGRAAVFFARLFYSRGIEITGIYGRDARAADDLAQTVGSRGLNSMDNLPESDLILLAVKDDVIRMVAGLVPGTTSMICHCAGSVSIKELDGFEHSGVFYPMQSLSENVPLDSVPILYEASDKEGAAALDELVRFLGVTGKYVNSDRRLYYHLSAVFANNFTNAVLDATHQLSSRYELDFELLKPLIRETFKRVMEGGVPSELQTGPALRGDHSTIQRHLELLDDDTRLKELYLAISHFISNRK